MATAANPVEAINEIQNLGLDPLKFNYEQAMINLTNFLGTLSGDTAPTTTQESTLASLITSAYSAYQALLEGSSSDQLYAQTANVQAVWGDGSVTPSVGVMNNILDGIVADGSLLSDAKEGPKGFDALGNLISYMNTESAGIDLSQLISDCSKATPQH